MAKSLSPPRQQSSPLANPARPMQRLRQCFLSLLAVAAGMAVLTAALLQQGMLPTSGLAASLAASSNAVLRRSLLGDTSQDALCLPRTWQLKEQNWTDGDPEVQDVGVCSSRGYADRAGSTGKCSAVAGIPKVAMLFLTMGKMRHETLWSLWLKQAAGLVPADCLAAAICGAGMPAKYEDAVQACAATEPGVLQRQNLFSVYVHLPPEVDPYPEESLFHGTVIQDRMNSSWGTFDLAQVARNLIAAGLADPLNQRFITVSESCIPLYPPAVVYHQLMYAKKSRINACTSRKDWGRDEYRWTWRLEEATEGRLNKTMWRKNHQWLGLTRKHARLVVADTEIAAAFAKHCYSGEDPDMGNWWRTCFSDEHYFSTLLAYHGLDEETDCMGELTHTFWCHSCSGDERLHPKTYKAEETTVALLQELRQESNGCNGVAALQAAAYYIPSLDQLTSGSACLGSDADNDLLEPRCPLFARKFTEDVPATAMHALFSLLLMDEGRVSARQGDSCEAAQDSSTHDARLPAGTFLADMSEKLGNSQERPAGTALADESSETLKNSQEQAAGPALADESESLGDSQERSAGTGLADVSERLGSSQEQPAGTALADDSETLGNSKEQAAGTALADLSLAADLSEKLGTSQEQAAGTALADVSEKLGNSQEQANWSAQPGRDRALNPAGGSKRGPGRDTNIISAHFERVAGSVEMPVRESANATNATAPVSAKEAAILRRKQRRHRGRRQVGGRDVK